jgi:putative transposase
VNEACNSGARSYKACEVLGISVRTLQRWRQEKGSKDRRKGANKKVHNKLSQAEQDLLLSMANAPSYNDLPACKIVPRLADAGLYIASERTLYRYLKLKKQLIHRQRVCRPKKSRPKMLCALRPNQVWTWDITYLLSTVRGCYYYLYLIVDVYSRCIVGWRIHTAENSAHASRLMRETCLNHQVNPGQLALHSDNGSPMKGALMLATLEKLGVAASFSRPSVSNDNAYSESLFRTLKYCNGLPRISVFASLEDATAWVTAFVRWYNEEHLHSAIKYVTPASRHRGEDKLILEKRQQVYRNASARAPQRWNGRDIRNWSHIDTVTLNPKKESITQPLRGQEFMHKPAGAT